VLLTVLKSGSALDLDIAERVKALLPSMRAAAPRDSRSRCCRINPSSSPAAIHGVLTEG